jgi:hypothetical protein
MTLRDFGFTLILIVIALVLGAAIFAAHDPGDKAGFYQPDGQPGERTP